MPSLGTQFLVAKTTRVTPVVPGCEGSIFVKSRSVPKNGTELEADLAQVVSAKRDRRRAPPLKVPKSAIFAGGKAPSEPGDFAPGRALRMAYPTSAAGRSIDGIRVAAEQLTSTSVSKGGELRATAPANSASRASPEPASAINLGRYVRHCDSLEPAVQDVHAPRVTGPSNRDGLPRILLSESEVPFGWSRASNGKTGSESASCHRPGTAC
jgi:hypothetical protein